MAIAHEDLNEDLRRIVLSGRLDFHGVEEIIEQLASLLASAGKNVVIDLSATTLICSMGIRALILNAKNLQQRGGHMALVVEDSSIVSTTLKSVGIDSLLPVFMSFPEAKNVLLK